MQMTLKHF